jgi:hypothetical protein
MDNRLEKSGYVKPYPQEVLNGELGVNSSDIAKSLGVPVENVRKKIKRGKYANIPDLLAIPYGITSKYNGLEFTEYAFNIRAAKAFVARWSNQTGDHYLNYLFDCEEIAEKHVPILKSTIDSLMRKLTRRRKTYIQVPKVRHLIDIFGEVYTEVTYEKIPYHKATDAEKAQYVFSHRSKTMKGLAVAQEKDLDGAKIIPMINHKLLKGKHD